ncbi:MAG: YihY/virulence factor BrkB family protein [Mycobacteriales bacterium]
MAASTEHTSAHQPSTADPDPSKPSELPKRSWWAATKRTIRAVGSNNLSDWAAALTYYSVLSIFPALLAAVSTIGLLSSSATRTIVDNISQLAPGAVRDILTSTVRNLEGSSGTASILVIVGIVAAWWSASGYIAAFMRASNAIYSMEEGRPMWKTAPLRLAITLLAGAILAISALVVALTGAIAKQVGSSLGLGSGLVTGWDFAKWPVLVLAISLLFAVLYWASPNVRQGGFVWVTPGSIVAVLIWVLASAAFGFYVAHFGSYNKTYGTLATPIIFLVWLWITNLAILFGAQLNAELERSRTLATGQDADADPFLPPRDTRAFDDKNQALKETRTADQ